MQFACQITKAIIQTHSNNFKYLIFSTAVRNILCKENPLLHFHDNTDHFYIVDSYIQAHKTKYEGTVAFSWRQ